jgi:hypothetical protein
MNPIDSVSLSLPSGTIEYVMARKKANEPDESSRLQARIKDLEKERIQMLSGKYIFAQLIEFLPQNYFQRLFMKY